MPIVTAEHVAYHMSKRSAATAEWVEDLLDPGDGAEFIDFDDVDPYADVLPGPVVTADPDAVGPFGLV